MTSRWLHDRLRGFVKGEVLSIPYGDAGVQLDRIVGLGRRDVGFVHFDRSGLKGRFGIAALAVDLGLFVGFQVVANVRLFAVIRHLDRIGCGDRLFEGKRHNGGDVLSVVADGVVFEGRTALIEIPVEVLGGAVRKSLPMFWRV